jgi:hypothetical protein
MATDDHRRFEAIATAQLVEPDPRSATQFEPFVEARCDDPFVRVTLPASFPEGDVWLVVTTTALHTQP